VNAELRRARLRTAARLGSQVFVRSPAFRRFRESSGEAGSSPKTTGCKGRSDCWTRVNAELRRAQLRTTARLGSQVFVRSSAFRRFRESSGEAGSSPKTAGCKGRPDRWTRVNAELRRARLRTTARLGSQVFVRSSAFRRFRESSGPAGSSPGIAECGGRPDRWTRVNAELQTVGTPASGDAGAQPWTGPHQFKKQKVPFSHLLPAAGESPFFP